jgi:hypothetical protein
MKRNIFSIRQFSERYPAYTQAALRGLRFYQETNGFADAFLNQGRKVLIDEDKFFACLDRINGRAS